MDKNPKNRFNSNKPSQEVLSTLGGNTKEDEMSKTIELGKGVHLEIDDTVNGTDAPVIQPTEVVKKTRGRQKGQKIGTIVSAEEFCKRYPSLVAEGKSIEEIGKVFGLKPMTVIQKRHSYNKASADAGHALNLPLPKSEGTRGAKKIDWAAMSKKIQEVVNTTSV